MGNIVTMTDVADLVACAQAGKVVNNDGEEDDYASSLTSHISWIEMVDMLRLPILDIDVTLWNSKIVRAWIARCLELPREAPKFKYTDGNQLLMIPIHERSRKKLRMKHRKPGQKASFIEEMYGIASSIKRKKLLLEVEALLMTRRRQRRKGAEGFDVENWKKIDITKLRQSKGEAINTF